MHTTTEQISKDAFVIDMLIIITYWIHLFVVCGMHSQFTHWELFCGMPSNIDEKVIGFALANVIS